MHRSPHVSPGLGRRLSLAAAVLLASFCVLGHAQASGLPYEELIHQAVVEFDANHWDEARVLFKRAHEQNPSARTWRGMGITAFELRRYVDAVAELEAALADPRKPLTEQQRSEVQVLLQRAREFVSVYRVRVRPGGAEVWVDGDPARVRDGQIFLDPGRHVLTVRAPGYAERRAELKVDAGGHEEMAVELELQPQAIAEPEPQPEPVREPEVANTPIAAPAGPGRVSRPVTWSLLGATAVALPIAVALRVMASNKSQRVGDRECADTDRDCLDQVADWAEKGRRQERSSYVVFGVAGALFGSAVLSFVLEGQKGASNTSVSIGPRSVSLRHAF